ncbi:MAG: C10 family peptidase [Candidatus Marinimicrobia bacterium]|nr:C10 family peptidase [Candidatus Neomarinimicrobiota bacterium]
MNKFIKILTIAIFIQSLLWGAFKTPREAEIFARNWLRNKGLSKSAANSIQKIETKTFQETPVLHIIHFQPAGFMILAADDNTPPVLAYSEESQLDIHSENPGLQAFLSQYSQRVYKNTKIDNQRTRAMWNNVESVSTLSDTIVPLVKTLWDQGWPYNKFCPVDSSAGSYTNYRVWAGCVATAMSQIMKFYNYPDSGRGSHSYVHEEYDTLSINLDSVGYEWSKMRNVIFSHSHDTLIDPIAQLMYHCGVAVNMGYGPQGSGAFSQDVPQVMMDYFDYSPETQYLNRASYSDANWKEQLKAELSDGRPIYYSGNDGEAGHAFVCDGYEKRKTGDYFHFNWGWSGSGNGYFTIDNMTFNYGQGIVINFAPKGKIAKFKTNVLKGVVPLTVQFTDLTEDETLIAWEWDFDGDGITDSDDQHPTWTYSDYGHFSITLRVTDGTHSYQKTEPNLIEVISKDEIYGNITANRTLEAGIIKVLGDIAIPENVTLTILPGAEMVFQGNYELKVDGNIIAEGSPDNRIKFSVSDTTGFSNFDGNSGGWKGIYLTGKANDTTSFKFCDFEFVKKSNAIRNINNNNLFLYKCTFRNNIGSVLGFWFNQEKRIKIDKCLFENNINHGSNTYANWGTAIVGYYANLDITNSIFANNKIMKAGVINLANTSTLNLVNCTITDNLPQENTLAVLDFSTDSELNIQNTILWNDQVNEIHFSGKNKISLSYTDLQSGLSQISGDAPHFLQYENNLNVDPQFADNTYQLTGLSQCIDRGTLPGDSLIIDSLDFKLDFRMYSNAIDLGAQEYAGNPENFGVGFTADIDSGGSPLEVTFSDTTKTDNIISVQWDFENDGTWDSDDRSEVVHVYDRPGVYSVSMLALTADSIPVFVLAQNLVTVSGEAVAIEKNSLVPENFYLAQNFPNPFNPSTTIHYGLPEPADVLLEIYNLLGQKVTTLEKAPKPAGHYSVKWLGTSDLGKPVPSGIYIYTLKYNHIRLSNKMFFMK